jgi:glycine/D-amino acid oxidase-like deaminating enzyme
VTTLPTAPANSGYATDPHGWAEMLSTRPARQPLNGDHRADWVVVGAGVTGLACARRLAELHPDKEVFLLDARQVGQGASGRNSGFAVGVSHFSGGFQAEQAGNYRRTNRINQAGVDLLRAQVSDHAIDCQWYEGGFHHTAADQSSVLECENFLRYLEALEIPHTPLDRDELQGRLGTGLYQSGVHVPQGALLQPAALVRGLADSLPENVTLTELSPVVSIENIWFWRPITRPPNSAICAAICWVSPCPAASPEPSAIPNSPALAISANGACSRCIPAARPSG